MGNWDDPVESSGEFISPKQLAGHLVIVAPLGYVPHIQTKFTRSDKPSDGILVDVVDLDAVGEDGRPGKLYRSSTWMQSKMIESLRPKVGKKVLGRIEQGVAKNGMNPPWILVSATGDPDAVKRADAWEDAHPEYRPSEFVIRERRDTPPQQDSFGRRDERNDWPVERPEPRREEYRDDRPLQTDRWASEQRDPGVGVRPADQSMLQQMRERRAEDERRELRRQQELDEQREVRREQARRLQQEEYERYPERRETGY